MFNKELMRYHIFIKNPSAESALQKTFLPRKIKNGNYEAATKGSSPKTGVHKINSKIRKALEKHPRRSVKRAKPPPKRQA